MKICVAYNKLVDSFYSNCFIFETDLLTIPTGTRKVYYRTSDGHRAESVREAHDIENGFPRRTQVRGTNKARTERRKIVRLALDPCQAQEPSGPSPCAYLSEPSGDIPFATRTTATAATTGSASYEEYDFHIYILYRLTR